jgi:hypothetical protein
MTKFEPTRLEGSELDVMIGNEKFPAIILCIQMAEINSTKYQTSFL